MEILRRTREAIILILGDTLFFCVALYIALILRYSEPPTLGVFFSHFAPFSILIIAWLLSFFIAGLYDRHTLLFRTRLPKILVRTQFVNSALAVAFFYLIPYFSVAPKTTLFIYIFVSSVLILAWRLYGNVHGAQRRHNAIAIGSGAEMKEFINEINNNDRYPFVFVSVIDLDQKESLNAHRDILEHVAAQKVSLIVIGGGHAAFTPLLPHLYNLLFSGIRFIDFSKAYEAVFDRIPLSSIGYKWFLENISPRSHILYDIIKRGMDIFISLSLGLVSLAIYPFVYIAVKLDDGGKIFLYQERVGVHGKRMNILKFRTMAVSDAGKWVVANDPRITRVGAFLRTARIDELPQLWNVLAGDMSLIGPRPELPELVKLYEKEIPYYNARHLLKPGLSGWGQIHHEKPPHSIEATKEKLSYDLYYLKNRSLVLDIEIALKTIKTILSRSGV